MLLNMLLSISFYFLKFINFFVLFWLCWVLLLCTGFLLRCVGFSLQCFLVPSTWALELVPRVVVNWASGSCDRSALEHKRYSCGSQAQLPQVTGSSLTEDGSWILHWCGFSTTGHQGSPLRFLAGFKFSALDKLNSFQMDTDNQHYILYSPTEKFSKEI